MLPSHCIVKRKDRYHLPRTSFTIQIDSEAVKLTSGQQGGQHKVREGQEVVFVGMMANSERAANIKPYLMSATSFSYFSWSILRVFLQQCLPQLGCSVCVIQLSILHCGGWLVEQINLVNGSNWHTWDLVFWVFAES